MVTASNAHSKSLFFQGVKGLGLHMDTGAPLQWRTIVMINGSIQLFFTDANSKLCCAVLADHDVFCFNCHRPHGFNSLQEGATFRVIETMEPLKFE